ncbi:MAG: ammonia-forming cytochrome c nitrite reductase subunit c552 [Armatimonadota bacterium]
MPQLFRPSSNTYAQLAVMGLAATPLSVMVILSQMSRGPAVTGVTTAVDQPVPFSHEHHVNELGIDCRYCHSSVETSAKAGYPATHTCMSCHSQVWSNSPLLEPVRESYEKNVPLKWTTLNKVPDFVFFNHSIHIKRGINCNNCHGPVQSMQMAYKGKPFQMRWCLECHRNPEKYVNEPGFVFDFYEKIRKDPAKLTAEEQILAQGEQYARKSDELAKGRELVARYHIKKEQLTDCAVCHH